MITISLFVFLHCIILFLSVGLALSIISSRKKKPVSFANKTRYFKYDCGHCYMLYQWRNNQLCFWTNDVKYLWLQSDCRLGVCLNNPQSQELSPLQAQKLFPKAFPKSLKKKTNKQRNK